MPNPADTFQPAYFDPLSTEHLTSIICREFEEQSSISLENELPSFRGPGLYAIYYEGDSNDLYEPLAGLTIPLYVGQSRSTNSATGKTNSEARPLCNRVRQHRRSITDGGLPIAEFTVRLLALPDVHIDMGENGLRVGYKPVWNAVLTGFGSHEQGSTTRRSSRSKWDSMHPGRARTFGESSHNQAALAAQVEAAIQDQVAGYHAVPWRRHLPKP